MFNQRNTLSLLVDSSSSRQRETRTATCRALLTAKEPLPILPTVAYGGFFYVPTPVAGCYLHFLCAKHAVDGYFEKRDGFETQCEIPGCSNLAAGYWYRGTKFAELPVVAR